MEVVLFVLMLLTGWHLIWESILAPSFRLDLRYKLFALRDRLRGLKIDYGNEVPNETFTLVDNSINGLLRHMPQYNITTLWNALEASRENPEYEKWINDRAAKLDACTIDGVKSVYNEAKMYAVFVFTVNIGAWMPYLLPFIILSLLIDGYKKLTDQLQKMLLANEKQWIQNLSDTGHNSNGVAFGI